MNLPEHRRNWLLLMQLAASDLWHDRHVSICITASLMAVIAPLLLLFGLKHGVVSQLQNELLSDPRNLEVRMIGNGVLGLEWFSELTALPSIGFSVPMTRSLNTQADLERDSRHFVTNAEIIPTGDSDPLLAGSLNPPKGVGEILLSASAAKKLDVEAGELISLLVHRRFDGQTERGKLQVSIIGILEPSSFTRNAALVSLDLLVAMEDFRDGYIVPIFGHNTGHAEPGPRNQYARARLYARSLDDVAPLSAWLAESNIETSTRLQEIESVQSINFVLGLIFSVIAWTAVLGSFASLTGAFLANIDRKRKDLALLRLFGFYRSAVGAYVMVQAALLTCVAFVLGYAAYLQGSTILNRALGNNLEHEGFVCQLENMHLFLAFTGAMLLATLVAGVGGLRAIYIQPAESLRQI